MSKSTVSRRQRVTTTPLLILLASLGLAACGGKDGASASHASGQVAATVNGDEISVHQVTDVLARIPGVNENNAPAARREVATKLVDQQLAVQAAIDRKLDRSPEVITALDNARREILARAFLGQAAGAPAAPDVAAAGKYYSDHPELFSERRLYHLEQVQIQGSPQGLDRARLRELAAARSIDQTTDALKQRGIHFDAKVLDVAAEQLPMNMLARIHAMKDGETLDLEVPQGITLVRLLSSRPAPVERDKALPRIEQFLANEQGQARVADAMKQLRAKARIDYQADYAPQAASAAVAAAATTTGIAQSAIDKGVDGLK